MEWRINDETLPSRGFVQIRELVNYKEIARIHKTGKAKYYALNQLPDDIQTNAHLIAAAPVMYETLKRIRSLIDSGDWQLPVGFCETEVNQITDAIVKAEGH